MLVSLINYFKCLCTCPGKKNSAYKSIIFIQYWRQMRLKKEKHKYSGFKNTKKVIK